MFLCSDWGIFVSFIYQSRGYPADNRMVFHSKSACRFKMIQISAHIHDAFASDIHSTVIGAATGTANISIMTPQRHLREIWLCHHVEHCELYMSSKFHKWFLTTVFWMCITKIVKVHVFRGMSEYFLRPTVYMSPKELQSLRMMKYYNIDIRPVQATNADKMRMLKLLVNESLGMWYPQYDFNRQSLKQNGSYASVTLT